MTPHQRREIAVKLLADAGNPRHVILPPEHIERAHCLTDAARSHLLRHVPSHKLDRVLSAAGDQNIVARHVKESPNGVIAAADPSLSDRALEIFAHECGHCASHHIGTVEGVANLPHEIEATQWGHERIAAHGGALKHPERLHRAHALMGYALHDSLDGFRLAQADKEYIHSLGMPLAKHDG